MTKKAPRVSKKRKGNDFKTTDQAGDDAPEYDDEGLKKEHVRAPKVKGYVDEVLERMKRKPKKEMEEAEKVEIVQLFLGRLEVAASKDEELFKMRRPACEKLKMLPELVEKCEKCVFVAHINAC